MDKIPNYKFVDSMSSDMDTCPIEILDGKYQGVVYRYSKISLTELENKNMSVDMNIIMINSPKDFDQYEKEFTETVGEIFVDIIEKDLAIEESPADLEDDVHQN